MSWSPIDCPRCSSTTTRFESAFANVPDFVFGLVWQCDDCLLCILKLCPLGPEIPVPGACLGCGGQIDGAGCCRECGSDRAAMVTRVREHCGEEPLHETIKVLSARGLYALAINALDLRLEQWPDDSATLVLKATMMLEVARPDRAVPLLRRAIELGAASPGVAILLGVALATSGRPEDALRVYAAHLRVETDGSRRAITLSNIGRCLGALGRVEEGEAFHRRAIQAAPDHMGARWKLFADLLNRNRYADALEVVEETTALSSIEADNRDNMQAYRAETLIAMRRHSEAALEAIDASLAGDPEDLARLEIRARLLVMLGRHDAAEACVATMLRIEPDNHLACRLLDTIERCA